MEKEREWGGLLETKNAKRPRGGEHTPGNADEGGRGRDEREKVMANNVEVGGGCKLKSLTSSTKGEKIGQKTLTAPKKRNRKDRWGEGLGLQGGDKRKGGGEEDKKRQYKTYGKGVIKKNPRIRETRTRLKEKEQRGTWGVRKPGVGLRYRLSAITIIRKQRGRRGYRSLKGVHAKKVPNE